MSVLYQHCFSCKKPIRTEQAYVKKPQPEHANCYIARIEIELTRARDELAMRDDCLERITQWIDAYPLTVFPEPDFKKAAKVLKDNDMTLDAISASNMRHVLKGIKRIIDDSATPDEALI